MKRFVLLFLAPALLFSSCGVFVDSKAFNNELSQINQAVNQAYNDYKDQAESTGLVEEQIMALETARVELLEILRAHEAEIKAVKAASGGKDLKNTFLSDVAMLIEMTRNEEKELAEVWLNMANGIGDPAENSSEESKLMETIEAKNSRSFEKITAAQEAFAEANDYILE